MGQPQIDEDAQLDDGDEDHRQCQALFHQQDNNEDGQHGHRRDNGEVVIRGLDHVLQAGRLADEHARGVVALEDGAQAADLFVYGVAGGGVLGVDEQQLPAVALQNALDAVGQDLLRDAGADHRLKPQHIFHAVHLLHLVYHALDGLGGEVGVHQHHVGGGDVEILLQLGVGDDIVHILRQALSHVVIDLVAGLFIAIEGGSDEQGEDHQKHGEDLYQLLGEAPHIGDDGAVLRLLQGLIQHKDHRRQHGDAAQHAQQHALGHDDAQIPTQREAHEAQGDEAGNGGHGAADDAGESGVDGGGHGVLFAFTKRQLLVVAVPEEDGVVHGDGQLQHGGQRLGDVGNLAQEEVGAQIQQDHGADGGQEHEGDQPAVQKQQHGHARQRYGQRHIDRLLLLAQVFQVDYQSRHAGHEALLAADAADLRHGVHGDILRGAGVEEHGHHGGMVGVEGLVDLLRQ